MYTAFIILHMFGIATGVGAGFAMMVLGKATSDMEQPERAKYMLRAFVISKMGAVGLILLLVSGIGMLSMRPKVVMAMGGGYFHAKLFLVVVFIGLFGLMQVWIKKAKKANGGPIMAKIPKLGGAMLLTASVIVILAGLAFH